MLSFSNIPKRKRFYGNGRPQVQDQSDTGGLPNLAKAADSCALSPWSRHQRQSGGVPEDRNRREVRAEGTPGRPESETELHFLASAHPNIVRVYEIYDHTSKGIPCLLVAMECRIVGELFARIQVRSACLLAQCAVKGDLIRRSSQT